MRLSRISSCLLSWFSCFLDFFCNMYHIRRKVSPFVFFVKCQSSFTLPPYVIWFWRNFWFSQLFINWFKIKFLCFSIFTAWFDEILFFFNYVTLWQVFFVVIFHFLSDFLDFLTNKITIVWIWWNNAQ